MPADAATPPDASLPEATESEPNNGNAATEVNAMAVPSRMSGTIDPASDLDIFELTLNAGDFLTWTLAAQGATLAPHLALSEAAGKVPNMVASGVAGATAVQEHFVLSSGKYYAFARDARNVGGTAQLGGPLYTYALTVNPVARTPIAVTFPSVVTGTLSSRTAVALYSFKATAAVFDFHAEVFASRKSPPSELDSRLSLFNATTKQWIITNDDPVLGQPDSKVGGSVAAGDYVLVLENVRADANDLSYELRLTTP